MNRTLRETSIVLGLTLPPVFPCSAAGSWTAEVEREIEILETPAAAAVIGAEAPDSVQEAERDRQLARARRALAIERAADSLDGNDVGPPSAMPLAARAIAIAVDGYTSALNREALLLDRAGAGESSRKRHDLFAGVWSEATASLLDLLDRRPWLWRDRLNAGREEIDLPGILLSLCLRGAYAGDAHILPRESLLLRMSTLPESLAICCLDAGRCREIAKGADCAGFIAGVMAASVEQDALADFRYAAAYWARPPDAPPRDPASDNRIACATIGYLIELLEASEADIPRDAWPGGRPAGSSVAPAEALRLIRGAGRLWPPGIDPFAAVPGLRNPRWGGSGNLLCDVALYRPCLAAANGKTLDWLRTRLTAGRRIVDVDVP